MKHHASGTTMSLARPRLVLKSSVASLAAAGLLTSLPVLAQDTNPAVSDSNTVVVTGVRKAAQSAQKIKRDADTIVDSIVADDIGKFPDTNVAETLARVTGIQVRRDAGEANSVLIRGLPGIATLLNGREMFTTTGRYIQLADVPSAMLAGVEVHKAQEANLPEGGIAGVVDVRTNRPFDFKGFTAALNGGATNFSQSKKTDPNVNGMVSNRWKTDAGEIGALFGVSYVRNHYQEERAFNTEPIDKSWLLPKLTGPDLVGLESIKGDRRRTAVNYALQWKPNKDVELYAEGLASRFLINSEVDFFVGLPWWGDGALMSATKIPGTDQLQTLTSHNVNTISSTQGFHANNLTQQHAIGGKWNAAPGLKLNAELARTLSTYEWQNPILDTLVNVPNAVVNTSLNGTTNVAYGGMDMNDASKYKLFQFFDRYGRDTGSSTDFRSDGTYTLDSDGLFKDFGFGLRVNSRKAESIKSFEGSVSATSGASVTTLPGMTCTATMTNNWGLQSWYTPCADYLTGSTADVRKAVTGTSAAKALDPGSYFADEEKNYALYGKVHVGWETAGYPVDGFLGMRVSKTNADLLGNSLVGTSYVLTRKSSSNTDYLPSANFKIQLRDDIIGRLSWTKTLTRPNFADLNPGTAYVNSGVTVQATASGGNPDLKPVTAKNFDASLEWYFNSTGMLSFAAFRHDFKGYILYAAKQETFQGRTYSTTRPYNSQNGELKGGELAYRQFFDKLPGWLGGFGVEANATYSTGTTETNGAENPFPGLSKWSYNLVALYEKNGFSGRLAYNWRQKFVQTYKATTDQSKDLWAGAMSSLDGSLSYKINDTTSVTINGTNLLNFTYKDYWTDNPSLYPRDTRKYDRTVGLYVNWKL